MAERTSANGMLDVDFAHEENLDELAEIVGIDFKSYLETEKPYLSSQQIKELIQQGFTIGAHSQNHPLYNELDEKEQVSQTLNSLTYIKHEFDLDYSVFSFPFTDDGVTNSFFKTIDPHVDFTFGSAGIKKDMVSFNLQRISMETNSSAEEIIKTQYFYCLLKKLVGKHQIVRL